LYVRSYLPLSSALPPRCDSRVQLLAAHLTWNDLTNGFVTGKYTLLHSSLATSVICWLWSTTQMVVLKHLRFGSDVPSLL